MNNKRALYESIMKNVAKEVKRTLNEELYKIDTAETVLDFRNKVNDTLVQFIFTKLNGDVRMAFGTANEDWLDYFDAPEKPVFHGYGVQFYDVEAEGWRALTLRRGTTTNLTFCQTFRTPKKLLDAIDNEEQRAEFVEEYMDMYNMNINTDETPEEAATTVEETPIVQAAPANKTNDDDLIEDMMSSTYASTWKENINKLQDPKNKEYYKNMYRQMLLSGELE